ncbi:hypothetical protein AX16_000977 [Volvariella volvacea WC 439]|nr:hypothetical protein AX16_000977 [Volvariella volvacea WC 439]
MFIAGKIYKEFNTTSKLHAITDVKLHALGVNAKEDRKLALSAFRKAGFYPKRKAPLLLPKLKRKRETDLNEYLPNGPAEESFSTSDFRFQEELDPQVLNSKFAVINRAPIMTAWVMTVAEHLGFKREEALSIASVYTEMNAIEKGVSIGLLNERATGSRVNTSKTGNQPWVEVLGRR